MTFPTLGEFLRARRALLDPHDAGLPVIAGRRRVAGLRREELAQLAGVSVSYYTRLEQGQSVNASEAVLDALAGALRLDEHERRHLHALASARPKRASRPPVERLDPLTRDLLRSLGDVPALVTGRRTDVLAWNALGHALIAGHVDPTSVDRPADRPNLARMLFLDGHTRELYVDWHRKARAVVNNLHHVAGRHPDDPLLAGLIGELSMKSPDFVALWRDHRVKPCEAASYELRHPLVGSVTITQHNFTVGRSGDQSLCLMTATEGSASADTLALLAGLMRDRSEAQTKRPVGTIADTSTLGTPTS
jgi:transcriptional regulator with XRE-family HTH domain